MTRPPSRMRAARRDVLLHHVGRRIEEHDRIVQRIEHEPRRKRRARRGPRRSVSAAAACASCDAPASSAFQSQLLDQLIKPAELVGIVAERAARVGERGQRAGRARPVPYRRAPAAASPPRPSHRASAARRAARPCRAPWRCGPRASSARPPRRPPRSVRARAERTAPRSLDARQRLAHHADPGRVRAARRSSMSRQIAAAFAVCPS